jgi:hypothetical protein
MSVRVLACTLIIGAASPFCAQESFNSLLLPANDDHLPAGRRAEPTVEIPTERDEATVGQPTPRPDPVVITSNNEAISTAEARSTTIAAPVEAAPPSAWLDLRQTATTDSEGQTAPEWVTGIDMAAINGDNGAPSKTLFRIKLAHPAGDYTNLLFRLLFDDKKEAQPELIIRDDSGAEISRSGALGSGIDLPSSESVVIPMRGASSLDIEVPGDGKTVRAAYIDWMKNSEVVQPVSADNRHITTETFAALPPLAAPTEDIEKFGTVTATLSADTIGLGAQLEDGATFQFGVESQPLLALLTFEVATPRIDAPPEVYLNGQDIGPATLMLPELSDPGYRGEMEALVNQMHFHYTGWVRAQKIVPVAGLKAADNELIIANSSGTAGSAIRATQIQLKYLWEKSDYILRPAR